MSKRIHQMTFGQWEKAFPTEEACQAYLVANRWPKAIHCPRCGAIKVHPVKSMPFKWQCYECVPNSGYR
ncbi:MAG: transposase, partial [Rhizomicrobium sp.]